MEGILEAISKIKDYACNFDNADGFFESTVHFDAVLMNFIVIGEMIDRLSLDFKQNNNKVDWIKIKNFRNIIAHDYFGIDAEEVWQIMQTHLKDLEEKLKEGGII